MSSLPKMIRTPWRQLVGIVSLALASTRLMPSAQATDDFVNTSAAGATTMSGAPLAEGGVAFLLAGVSPVPETTTPLFIGLALLGLILPQRSSAQKRPGPMALS